MITSTKPQLKYAVVIILAVAFSVTQSICDMMKDSPVTFPEKGPIPAKYPLDKPAKGNEAKEKGYYIFSSPQRSLAQIDKIQTEMPKGQFSPPPNDWKFLKRTRRILTKGGKLHLLALGDSIVNDTMRSGWLAKLREAYPKAEIKGTVYVRGGGGSQHYKEENRIAKNVVPRKPDLVIIGGISQKSIEDIRTVIRQLRKALPEVEIILATGVFGTSDPRDPEELSSAAHSGTGKYGRLLKKLASEECCAYIDMTSPWAQYIRSSKLHPHMFYRDAVHANEYGEQILSKILMSFFRTTDAQASSRLTPSDRTNTAIGDWGHFISYTPTVYFDNPQGKAFTIKVHVMQWPNRDWRRGKIKLRLVGPDNKVLSSGEQECKDSKIVLDVESGKAGVYRLHTTDNVWIESSLERSVVWTGVPGMHIMDDREPISVGEAGKKRSRKFYEKRGQLVFQAAVPRRWWFWVPSDVTEFSCRAMRADRCMSQREDWGYFIITPRGQRIRALWGQPPHTAGKDYRRDQVVTVEVEPGAAGRFWSLEVSLADSHQYSNINFSLDGVPPYLSRSPEEWFNPATGKRPEVSLYDDTPFIQSAKTELLKKRWPALRHFSPCPSLGDPDGIEVIGDATYALWNPKNRELGYRIGTYLPRGGFKDPAQARVQITSKGKTILDERMPMHHLHNEDGHPTHRLKDVEGVCYVSVSDVERFMTFTYPATPLVLIGRARGDGWRRFSFSACAPRNWYFFVPEGTKTFDIRVKAKFATDVLNLEICSPDRVVELIYGNQERRTVSVPKGLDNKIWYLRPSVGSATRMITKEGPDYRYQNMPLTLDLKGVPGYLAPTWEQWFNPENPVRPFDR